MKNKHQHFSRRRFLTATTLGVGAIWASSNHLCANAVRGVVDDTRRRVSKPSYIPDPSCWNDNGITAAWLGHSSVLVNFYGLTILTDPVLYNRVGVNTPLGTVGAKRYVSAALTPSQLPEIDLVLLSHAHMDHLDPRTLSHLPGTPRAVTARNTTDLIQDTAVRLPVELGWGESSMIGTRHGVAEVTAFEVRHWGARWRYDRHRGYNGYVVEREGRKIIFGGDTAYTDTFKPLAAQAPYEMAIMPIGAYDPHIVSHCTPEEAVTMANHAGARHFLPVHFKTFPLGREGRVEPLERLEACLEPERLGWREIGESIQVC